MLSKIVFLLCTLLTFSSNIQANVPSPRASADLICHTSHASECYPKIFQPSDEFKLIHDDQEVPPGLHYRLDLTTGKKEAKLNVPDEDEGYLAQTVDVSVLDDELVVANALSPPDQLGQKVVKAKEDAGSIRPPKSSTGESQVFGNSLSIFRNALASDTEQLLPTIETLEDLSHDIHWGLKLTEDPGVVHKLIELLNFNQTDSRVRGAAALLFGTAIQNNPAALAAALSHFHNDELPDGPMEAIFMALLHDQLPQLLTRFVYLLSALAQDQQQLMGFVKRDGLGMLVKVFDAEHTGEDEKDRLRAKIANFILDRLLQPDSTSSFDSRPKQSGNEDEVESRLENEDPWILPSGQDGEVKSIHQSRPKHRSKAQVLQPWCSSFSTSLTKWDSKKKDLGLVAAAENVEEAYTALQNKLKALGCSCDDLCHSPERS